MAYMIPKNVQEAAIRALKWIQEGKAGSGFTDVGRSRARQLASGGEVSLDVVKRMKSYFARHVVDKQATGFNYGEKGYPSAGRVAWDAWGGDAGQTWVNSLTETYDKSNMYGFDIDNTLADTKFKDIQSMRQLVEMYKTAKVLYTPRGEFVAITARGDNAEVKAATRLWLKTNYGDKAVNVYFASGSEKEKITFKANKVKELKLKGYVDAKVATLELFEKFGIAGIDLYKLNITEGTISLWKRL